MLCLIASFNELISASCSTNIDKKTAKVKLYGACHVNKLPPMTADGEPILQVNNGAKLIRSSHGVDILNSNDLKRLGTQAGTVHQMPQPCRHQ